VNGFGGQSEVRVFSDSRHFNRYLFLALDLQSGFSNYDFCLLKFD